jgi:hypothetical protein
MGKLLAGQETATFDADGLINGPFPVVTLPGTLITGQNLKRGAPLGRITASGKFTLSDPAAVDGSEVPIAVLAEDTDASSADVVTPLYFSGQFDPNFMDFTGSDYTATTIVPEFLIGPSPIFVRAAI